MGKIFFLEAQAKRRRNYSFEIDTKTTISCQFYGMITTSTAQQTAAITNKEGKWKKKKQSGNGSKISAVQKLLH